ncbi:hypothetical protein GF357_01005 [Candidatus Dojkabacteria bacterium]|nr:hypothetical protein [Candidatus Dojkabacteria bacterium]
MAFNQGNKGRRGNRRQRRESRTPSKTISIRRVAKVYSGGRRLNFSAMVVCGNKKGSVGVALGKGSDPRSAIQKATRKAEKNMVKIQVVGDTIPHAVNHKHKAARIIMRPAKPGTGVIAGPAGRALTELAGIENVYVKQLGSDDLISNTYCVFEALQKLRSKRVIENMNKMKDRIQAKREADEEERKKRRNKRNNGRSKRRSGSYSGGKKSSHKAKNTKNKKDSKKSVAKANKEDKNSSKKQPAKAEKNAAEKAGKSEKSKSKSKKETKNK